MHPEKSVWNNHSTLYNIPEDRKSHQYRGGSLKSRMVFSCLYLYVGIIIWLTTNIALRANSIIPFPLVPFSCFFLRV